MKRTAIKYVIDTLFYGCAFFLLLSINAQSSIIVDQMTVDVDPTAIGLGAVGKLGDGTNRNYVAAQTVTTGISGFLSQIDVWLQRQAEATGNVVLDVLGGGIHGGSLASISIPASSITSTPFTFSVIRVDVRGANVFMDEGDSFAISLSAPDAPIVGEDWTPFFWAVATNDPYQGGSWFTRRTLTSPWVENSYGDQALRTWVEPATIPEPATLSLLALGAMLAGRRRRN